MEDAILIIGVIAACIPWLGWFFIIYRQYKYYFRFYHEDDLETSEHVKNGDYEVH